MKRARCKMYVTLSFSASAHWRENPFPKGIMDCHTSLRAGSQ